MMSFSSLRKYIVYAAALISMFSLMIFGSVFAFASSSSNVAANVVVTSVCYTSPTPSSITFGTTSPNTNIPTNVLVTDQDVGGNIASYMFVSGTTWASGSNTFGISNTTWDASSQSTYTGTHLSSTASNTAILIPAPTISTSTTSNDIYFGLAVPSATPPGTYTQTITIENSC